YKEIKSKVISVLKIFLMANCSYIKNGNNNNWIDVKGYLTDIGSDNREEVIRENIFNSFIRFSNKDVDAYLLDISLLNKISISTKVYEEIIKKINYDLNISLENKEYYKAVINMFNIDLMNTYFYRMRSSVFKKENKDTILLPERTEWETKIPYYPT